MPSPARAREPDKARSKEKERSRAHEPSARVAGEGILIGTEGGEHPGAPVMHALAIPTPLRMSPRAGPRRSRPVAFIVPPIPGLAGIPRSLESATYSLASRQGSILRAKMRDATKIRGYRQGTR